MSALDGDRERPIALLLDILSGGGAQRRIATLANRFVALGRRVDLVSVVPDGPMCTLLDPAVRTVALSQDRNPPALSTAVRMRALTAYLDRVRPVALMSCVTDTHLLAVLARRRSRVDIPLILRASRHPYRLLPRASLLGRLTEPIKRRKTQWFYAQADAVVALSADGADGIRRLLRGQRARIETILNPVVARTLLDGGESRPARGDREPLVLGVGRFVPQKDFETLLRAFALLRARRPARLVLLGRGRQAARLRRLAARLGIADALDMPGEVVDVARWMRRADVLVSSSLWEGLQATPIEALALGCPVVATDCPGGARDTLDGGRLGALVPARDPARMAAAIEAMLRSPPDPMMLAAGATRFTAAGKAEGYLALFDSLGGARPAKGSRGSGFVDAASPGCGRG